MLISSQNQPQAVIHTLKTKLIFPLKPQRLCSPLRSLWRFFSQQEMQMGLIDCC